MDRERIIRRLVSTSLAACVAIWLFTACQAPEVVAPPVKTPNQVTILQAEVVRLATRVNALELQLTQEHRYLARARQETIEQRERIAALEGQVAAAPAAQVPAPQPTSPAVTMQAEAELKVAYRALMRAIERLDISAEEKAALKSSLKPSRSLDRENPWSMAKY